MRFVYIFVILKRYPRNTTASMTYLDSRLGQTGFGGQPFASAHARIVALVELFFQLVELIWAERGPVAPKLRLLGPAAAAHALQIVFAAVHATGSVA